MQKIEDKNISIFMGAPYTYFSKITAISSPKTCNISANTWNICDIFFFIMLRKIQRIQIYHLNRDLNFRIWATPTFGDDLFSSKHTFRSSNCVCRTQFIPHERPKQVLTLTTPQKLLINDFSKELRCQSYQGLKKQYPARSMSIINSQKFKCLIRIFII